VVDDTARYLAAGVEQGAVRPTSDERARAIMLTTYSLGSLVLARFALAAQQPNSDPDTPVDEEADSALARFDDIQELFGRPALEVFTYGLFTDDRLLRAYEAYQEGSS
jgi:TetR/AcrR family transcriptional regulator, regulator of cefoperazone and chloramphenicol sensitivity